METPTTPIEEEIIRTAVVAITLIAAKVVAMPTEENCNKLKNQLQEFTKFINELKKRKNHD